ncbi:MAG: hypothetical protein ACRDN0_21925 [Trebonia sp.]
MTLPYRRPYYRPDERLQAKREEAPVLRRVAEGVLVHQSEFVQSNAVVVQGRAGVLLIDPGILDSEMACFYAVAALNPAERRKGKTIISVRP